MQLVPLKEKDENSFQGFSCTAPQENQHQALADESARNWRSKTK
jgi:hypothetical protein